jgi:hypothetical protein
VACKIEISNATEGKWSLYLVSVLVETDLPSCLYAEWCQMFVHGSCGCLVGEEDREADVHATRGLGLLLLGRPHSTRTLPNSPEITDEQPSPEVQSNRQFLITDAKG